MAFLMKAKTKLMINWLSFCGYFISSVVWYFLFDIIYCYIRRPREQQSKQDDVMMVECVNCDHARAMMVVGTRTVINNIRALVIQDYKFRELEEAYSQSPTSHLYATNSDDSDYDGDDECSEDDDTDKLGKNNGEQNFDHHGRNPDDAHEERFEMVSEQLDIITAKPSKPKKTKSSKKRKAKLSKAKRNKPSQLKKKKGMRNGATAEQQKMDSISDDLMYGWDGGTTLSQHNHPIKGPRDNQSTATVDQGPCTTPCVQCLDTD